MTFMGVYLVRKNEWFATLHLALAFFMLMRWP
jgi:hypothetical protein